jgi:glycerol uptake facilitator protein
MSQYLAEFVGTFLLILLGNGTVAGVCLKHSKAENSGWIVIVVGWGLAVTLGVYAAGSVSGAHLNPAVSFALILTGDFPLHKFPGYVVAQLLGAFTASIFVWLQYLPHWGKTGNPEAKLAVFCTTPAVRSLPANLLSEVVATAVFIFGLMAIGSNKFAEGLNPLVVGALVSLIGIALGGTTGFAINPARDLGPRIAHFILPVAGKGSSDWAYSWIPVVGPIIGAAVGVSIFQLLF